MSEAYSTENGWYPLYKNKAEAQQDRGMGFAVGAPGDLVCGSGKVFEASYKALRESNSTQQRVPVTRQDLIEVALKLQEASSLITQALQRLR